jgi:hypothetical protein
VHGRAEEDRAIESGEAQLLPEPGQPLDSTTSSGQTRLVAADQPCHPGASLYLVIETPISGVTAMPVQALRQDLHSTEARHWLVKVEAHVIMT